MATEAELIARRDALRKAIDSGVRQVTSNGETVVYRTLSDMYTVLNGLNDEISTLQSSPRARRYVFTTNRGY